MAYNLRPKKKCENCKEEYAPRSNRQKYCDDCAGSSYRDRKNMNHYGVTKAKFEEAVLEAAGICPLCGHPEIPDDRNHKLVVDHDHATMVFRGLICRNCNMGMGFIDNQAWLEKALAWRERGRG